MTKPVDTRPAAEQIDDIVALHGGWKGELMTKLRAIINRADPEVVEEVKWKMPSRPKGLPVWSHNGILCIAETFKDNVKLVFFKGAAMDELQHLFNARLKSSTDRAIEFHEDDEPDPNVISTLVRRAIALNEARDR